MDKPKVSKVARYQMANMPNLFVTNNIHKSVKINRFDRLVGKYMDGKNTVAQLVDKAFEDGKANEFRFELGSEKVTDEAVIKQHLKAKLDDIIVRFFKLELLV